MTEAEGAREAAILRAEGEKQATILEAEGDRESEILRAEAAQRAAVLRYQGMATGLETLTASARALDANTMTLQYLDALKAVGKSRSTKIVVPVELTGLVQQFGQLVAGGTERSGQVAGEELEHARPRVGGRRRRRSSPSRRA